MKIRPININPDTDASAELIHAQAAEQVVAVEVVLECLGDEQVGQENSQYQQDGADEQGTIPDEENS